MMKKLFISLSSTILAASLVAQLSSNTNNALLSSSNRTETAQAEMPYSISVADFAGRTPETSGGWNNWTCLSLTTATTVEGWACTWDANVLKVMTSSAATDLNEWLFTPTFNFRAGYQYEVSYVLKPYGSSTKEYFDFAICESTTDVSNAETFFTQQGTNSSSQQTFTATYNCAANRVAAVGLRYYWPNGTMGGGMSFVSFSIKEIGSAKYPSAVSNLTVTPGNEGALTAKVAFTAPTTDKVGATLTNNLSVKIYRDDTDDAPATTLTNVAPGADVEWTDTDAPQGEVTYIVVAYDGTAAGEAANTTVWVGEDEATAVGNLTATHTNNAAAPVTVSWTAPTAGVHGAWLNTATLSYGVTRIVEGNATAISPTITNCSFTDNYQPANGQEAVYYQVYPITSAGPGVAAETNKLTLGTAAALPFEESFADTAYSNSGWYSEVVELYGTTQPVWTVAKEYYYEQAVDDDDEESADVVATSHDVDNGLIYINTNYVSQGSKCRLVSPAFVIENQVNPVLTFYFWEDNNTTSYITENGRGDDRIQLEISADNGEFVPVEGVLLHRHSQRRGWRQCRVSLLNYTNSHSIRLGFLAISGGAGAMCLDDILVANGPENDMAVSSVTYNSKIHALDDAGFYVTVTNNGGHTVDNYDVQITVDNQPLNGKLTEVVSLAPLQTATLPFTGKFNHTDVGVKNEVAATVSAVLSTPDEVDYNDTFIALDPLTVVPALMPYVTDLAVASQGSNGVTLRWSEPNTVDDAALEIVDDFESYNPWDIANVGNYTFVDLDRLPTYYPVAAASYNNAGAAMAFQVYRPADIIDDDELSAWSALSGEQYLAAMAPVANDSGTANTANDWLISPLLSGNYQTISFYARHLSMDYTDDYENESTYNYPESFVLLYTDEDSTDPNDFFDQATVGTVTTESSWTKYEYALPSGTKRFAIRHITTDGYIFMLDDLNYFRSVPSVDECGLSNYTIYRDGEPYGTSNGKATKFVDANPGETMHTYYVTANYANGESLPSNSINYTFDSASITTLQADGDATIDITARQGHIFVNTTAAIEVYNISGAKIAAGTAANVAAQHLAPGIYIVNVAAASTPRRVLVK
jgi:hypothetical protein